MSDLESLFLVLAALYLLECATWVRRGAVGFASSFGTTWRVVFPGGIFGNRDGGVVWANPLPPLGRVILCQGWPVSLSADGIYAYVSQAIDPVGRPPQRGGFVRYEEIRSVGVSAKHLLVNGGAFVHTVSPRLARRLARLVRDLRAMPASKREDAIEAALVESLDTAAVSSRVRELERRSRPVRWLANALFVHLFVVVPLVAHLEGLARGWPLLLFLLAALLAATLVATYRAHRALLPDERGERASELLRMGLLPPAAIRAPASLERDLFASDHPLALARVLCSERAYLEFARRVVLDMRFPILLAGPSDDPGPRATERWYRGALGRAVERHLREAGVDVGQLLAPPRPYDPETRSYCPRCRNQYATRAGDCGDCGGLALQSL